MAQEARVLTARSSGSLGWPLGECLQQRCRLRPSCWAMNAGVEAGHWAALSHSWGMLCSGCVMGGVAQRRTWG